MVLDVLISGNLSAALKAAVGTTVQMSETLHWGLNRLLTATTHC